MKVPSNAEVEQQLRFAQEHLAECEDSVLHNAVVALLKAVELMHQQKLAAQQRWFP